MLAQESCASNSSFDMQAANRLGDPQLVKLKSMAVEHSKVLFQFIVWF